MKRTFAVVLVFAMVLSLCGCGRTSLSNHKGMEYVCDPARIQWKLRLLDYVQNTELEEYRLCANYSKQ